MLVALKKSSESRASSITRALRISFQLINVTDNFSDRGRVGGGGGLHTVIYYMNIRVGQYMYVRMEVMRTE